MSPVTRYGVPVRCQALSFKTLAALVLAATGCARHDAPPNDWRVTGGEPGNSRYSSLDQINRGNVGRLRVAWTYHTGDIPTGGHSEIQARASSRHRRKAYAIINDETSGEPRRIVP